MNADDRGGAAAARAKTDERGSRDRGTPQELWRFTDYARPERRALWLGVAIAARLDQLTAGRDETMNTHQPAPRALATHLSHSHAGGVLDAAQPRQPAEATR